MRKLFEKIWKKEEGFTLIELIIVIAILAIIAAIAVPNVLSAVDNSRKTTDVTNAKMIADAAATVRAMNDTHSAVVEVCNFTDGTATAFETAIVNQLNGVAPVPKYQGTTINEQAFVLNVESNGNISVYTAATGIDTLAEITSAAAIEVFPTPDSEYSNQ